MTHIDEVKQKLDDLKKKRFQFLNKVYERTDGDEYASVNMWEIGKELGFDRDLTQRIQKYLQEEGLIEARALGGEIGMSHRGVCEVEDAISNPDRPTSHFLPINIVAIGHMTNSQIQQAGNNATQVATISVELCRELGKLVQSLEESITELKLGTQQTSDINVGINAIKAQLSSPTPKTTVVTKSLTSIKHVLEGAAGNVIAATLLAQIAPLLASL